MLNVNKHDLLLMPSLKKALVSLYLEGITLNQQSLSDLILFSEGKLSKEEAIDRAVTRAKT